MVQPDFGGALDTPRTNIGDATYLSRAPDFDISQEASFQSPVKEGNFIQQLRNGGRSNGGIRTPRQRGPLADRRNLPPSVGGAEFTPLLKSATRNSVRRFGKENGTAVPNTPALDKIDESDLTPVPRMDTSMYTGSRNQSYLDNTLPQVDDSSAASTPMALPSRRGGDKGPLQDGNQLSLREQENVIDRIEKENFGLKLKIHFLEEALRKAGPGFSEAALKENTELKVDKVTMQRELHRYKKHLTTAEKDLESYRQSMLELQEKAKRKYANENQRAEMDKLQRLLKDREADIEDLQRQLNQGQKDNDQVEKLRDDIEDMESDLRDKDRMLTEREDELEDLKDKLEEAEDKAKDAQRKMIQLEEKAQKNDGLEEAKDTIQDLEHNIRRLEEEVEDAKTKLEDAEARREDAEAEMKDAVAQKDRAENDLEELQDEMSNKSVVTKGLSRQIEEKVLRLQEELDKSGQEYAILEKELSEANHENEGLQSTVKDLQRNQESFDRERRSIASRVEELEADLLARADDKNTLQSRHDSMASQTASLQKEVTKLEREVEDLEESLAEEREHALGIEKDLRGQYQGEINRLNDEVSDLQAEIREKDNLYDNDSEKWETEKQNLESERDHAEEKASGLQRTIDRLREAEGTLSDKESRLQAAIQSEAERHKGEEGILTRQIEDLQDALETRQTLLTNLRNELSTVRDELRQTQVDYQSQLNRVAALEDEVDVLQNTLHQEQGSGRRDKITKEKQSLQDQLAKNTLDFHSVSSSLAEAKAERDELEAELRRAQLYDNETIRVDQERLDLRTAKLKLDNEVRRLKDENRALAEQRESIEKTLEDEIEKAAEEEERLGQEVLQLQSKLRQSSTSETHDLATARRTIRDLERRVEDFENQLTTRQLQMPGNIEGNSELSLIRKDLTAARQKELDFLQRESANRDMVKGLKRQVADLERQVHETEVSRLIVSPRSSASDSGRKSEVSELRHQLSTAQQSIHELRSKNRETERKVLQASQGFQRQLDDLEDQKIVLEEVLDEARQQAEETAAQHERLIQRMKHKLDKAERERNTAAAQQTDSSKQDRQLRKSRAEMENLEHDVRQQQELIDSLAASEASLRRKLERARSERAAFRLSAEKLQKDLERARASAAKAAALNKDARSESPAQRQAMARLDTADQALETVIRAAEGAEERHKKELRGMVMQMEWMQARWKREASLRADAAYAKKFIQLQLDIANACNKAQLRELEDIRTNLLGNRKPLSLPASGSNKNGSAETAGRPSLKTFLVMARFIARMRISARDWAKQETVRQRLVVATEEQRKTKRSRQLKVVRAET
ncbi:putative spindle-pole body protein [Ilyonectria destructans]|nr:putative spindle-pole body protein [Ilyonectria destructans]